MNIFSNEDLNIYLKSVREHKLITHGAPAWEDKILYNK